MPVVFSTEKIGWAGTRHIKGVYYALVLTVRNLVNFIECQKTKQRECPVGVLYTCHYYAV